MTTSCIGQEDASRIEHVVRELEKHKSAVLIYDRAGIRRELDLLTSHLKQAGTSRLAYGVRFSIKANSNVNLLRWLAEEGVGAEIASMAEFRRARESGMQFISATAPGLSIRDVGRLFAYGVELNIDNLIQLDGVPPASKIGLRLCMPLESTADGHESQQSRFGLDINDVALHERLRARNHEVVRLHGHFRDIGRAEQLKSLARRLVSATKIFPGVATINLGGGMTRLYRDPTGAEQAWLHCASVFRELPDGTRLLVEPGAQLTTNHGYLGTRVLSVTHRSNGRQLAVINSSRWNLITWSKYELIYPIPKAEGVITDIVGPTCYENDIWIVGVQLPELQPGQQLIFKGVGAYVASMAKRMHELKIPREILV